MKILGLLAEPVVGESRQDIVNLAGIAYRLALIGKQRTEAYEELGYHRWNGGGSRRRNSLTCVVCRWQTDEVTFTKDIAPQIGTPDLILTSPAVQMKPINPEYWGALAPVPTGLTEDRYVAAMEIKERTVHS